MDETSLALPFFEARAAVDASCSGSSQESSLVRSTIIRSGPGIGRFGKCRCFSSEKLEETPARIECH